jgi:hypothetical protein
MANEEMILRKTKDGQEGLTYVLIWPGDNPEMICELSMFPNPVGEDYLFNYTDSRGETTPYSTFFSAKTPKEGSERIVSLLEQKAKIMSQALKTRISLTKEI